MRHSGRRPGQLRPRTQLIVCAVGLGCSRPAGGACLWDGLWLTTGLGTTRSLLQLGSSVRRASAIDRTVFERTSFRACTVCAPPAPQTPFLGSSTVYGVCLAACRFVVQALGSGIRRALDLVAPGHAPGAPYGEVCPRTLIMRYGVIVQETARVTRFTCTIYYKIL